MIRRILVEKKQGFDVEKLSLLSEIKNFLGIDVTNTRMFNMYDVDSLTDSEFLLACNTVFADLVSDNIFYEDLPFDKSKSKLLYIKTLPGQFDIRQDAAIKCVDMLFCGKKINVSYTNVLAFFDDINDSDLDKIKSYLINKVEASEVNGNKPESLEEKESVIEKENKLDGFIALSKEKVLDLHKELSLSMSVDDLLFCQNYFANEEKRDPFEAEIKMIDTYWSDHCRHTTFLTAFNDITLSSEDETNCAKETYEKYLSLRDEVYGKNTDKKQSLMDLACIMTKSLKKRGEIKNLDESEEINACSYFTEATIDGKSEKYTIQFKNETHNHPTEIEPFGGAATCLGGAIRDPLSGRVYVSGALRVSGAANILEDSKHTLKGKLAQRQISTKAAAGYRSYGNQIGLATGSVREIYHEGYKAKRMELGAVLGAAPSKNIVRIRPQKGDLVLLLGADTGRDGIGGATGSSVSHDENAVLTRGAEVQKGNPPIERAIMRLFRRNEVTTKIIRCNDFGAGGISVAIGEIADSLDIFLDKVTLKYKGLKGLEIALSESQERMAVVIKQDDLDEFIALCASENVKATHVANVTDTGFLRMYYKDELLVNISRKFLDTNGVTGKTDVISPAIKKSKLEEALAVQDNLYDNLNSFSQRGLKESFDSTVGAKTVLMPYGGKYQATEQNILVQKLPLIEGKSDDCMALSYGDAVAIAEISSFHSASFAIALSVARLVSANIDYKNAFLSLQEYFPKMKNANYFGLPFNALLGALSAQIGFNLAAIGGKDSMSGTFNELDVPPTLISFISATSKASTIVSADIKNEDSYIYLVNIPFKDNFELDYDVAKSSYDEILSLMSEQKIISADAISSLGTKNTLLNMCRGNKIGVEIVSDKKDLLNKRLYGSIIVEATKKLDFKSENIALLGVTNSSKKVTLDNEILCDLASESDFETGLESVFHTKAENSKVFIDVENYNGAKFTSKDNDIYSDYFDTEKEVSFDTKSVNEFLLKNLTKANVEIPVTKCAKVINAKPLVTIPVFPGTNSELDLERQFLRAGANVNSIVINTLSDSALKESVDALAKSINQSQILAFAGGFSGSDEPDGSAKFIASLFRGDTLKNQVSSLLANDGLILGICNGFQALVKLGLLPFGKIIDANKNQASLTFNSIGRHISRIATTKIMSNHSPWLSSYQKGDLHKIAVSHGEGRFVASKEALKIMIEQGQIATCYTDLDGNVSDAIPFNPNGSYCAIEGITSLDGRIYGKMGHSERYEENVYKNIYGDKNQNIFANGVNYFKG